MSARLPPDLHQRFKNYREERGIDTTTAVRRLLTDGLDAQQTTEPRWLLLGISSGLLTGYLGLLYVGTSPTVWKVLTGALITLTILYATTPTLISLYTD